MIKSLIKLRICSSTLCSESFRCFVYGKKLSFSEFVDSFSRRGGCFYYLPSFNRVYSVLGELKVEVDEVYSIGYRISHSKLKKII